MGIVDDAIEDRVGDGRFADHLIPGCHGELSSDQRGFTAVAFFEDFEEVEALLVIETVSAPVVQNEQLDSRQLVDDAREPSVQARKGEVFEQPGHAQVQDGVILARGLAPERTSQPGLSRAGLASNDEILIGLEPGALGEREDIAPVDAAMHGEVDIFDAGVGKAQLGTGQPVGQPPVSTACDLPVEHQPKPLVPGQIAGSVLVGDVAPRSRHAGKPQGMHLIKRRMCQHKSVLSLLVIGTAADVAVDRCRLDRTGCRPDLVEPGFEDGVH
jgi:hypothetical protein